MVDRDAGRAAMSPSLGAGGFFVERPIETEALRSAVARSPVTLLTGPRQAGKSTLVRRVITPSPAAMFDLEDYRDVARLADPMLALRDRGRDRRDR